MLKQFYKITAALLLAGMVNGCTSDLPEDTPLAEGNVPVQLNGMLRSLGDADDPGDGELITIGYPLEAYSGVQFYLSARTVDAPVSNYLLNQKISIGAKNTTDQGRNKLDGTVYYPLGEKAINLFSYTGSTISENGDITLTTGTETKNDYLLGVGTEADGETLKSGTSKNPVKHITYKHLMTRVDVKIEVDDDVEDTKPQSVTMQFYRSGSTAPIANRGTYNIFTGGNSEGNATSSPNESYSFSNITTNATTHYLVPNGTNLTTYTGQIFSSVKIDDYKATAEDLAALKFSKAKIESTGAETDFILNPGLAYDLTFVIKRLKITEIKVTVKPWTLKSGETEWGYEPKTMTLNTGTEYDGSDITKMVLKYKHTDDKTYQYIGVVNNQSIDFVTLPVNVASLAGLTADLYTADGLLSDDVTIEPDNDELKVLNIGQYGMKINSEGGENIYEISTPLQLALLVNNGAAAGRKYKLVKSLDMNNNSVELTTSQEFPSGAELNGNGQDILHFEIEGDGLFTVNNGTLKNFRVASGTITGNASICGTNNGTIEAVANEADVVGSSDATVGGIAATNGTSGTIIASVNAGDVLGGSTVGGIVGENKNTSADAIVACLNVGMLNRSATNLGGIIGTSAAGTTSGAIVNTCYWLTGTARKNQAVSDEVAVGNSSSVSGVSDERSADLAASSIRGEAIGKLNTALGSKPWAFELDTDKSSWPMAKPKP